MEAVGAVVDSQFIVYNTIQCKCSTSNAVTVAAADCSEVRFFRDQIIIEGIMSGNYIG